MGLFDKAFATAKNLAKELGDGGIPAVHCGGKIRGEGFEAACTRSIRGCDPLVLYSWEEVNYKGVDTPDELGFIQDPSYRYDIHAAHLHGYPTQKTEGVTFHSNDLGALPKVLRNCRGRAEEGKNCCIKLEGKKENHMKNERGGSTADLYGPAILCVPVSGGTGFDCDVDGDNNAIGNVCIHPSDIEKAIAKIISPKLWGAVKEKYDWTLLQDTINDLGLETGTVSGRSWESPSQYFEDPGDSGYTATLSLENEPLSKAIDSLLYTFGQIILDALTDEPKYIGYEEDAKDDMLAAAKEDPAILKRLQELGLDYGAIDTLFDLENTQAAQDIYNLLWALDGSEDSN